MTITTTKGEELDNKPNWQTGQTHWSPHTNSGEKMFSKLYNHNEADQDWDDTLKRAAYCFCCKAHALTHESTESNTSVFLMVLYLQRYFYL